MNDRQVLNENEIVYNRGRMDEKQSVTVQLYCMDMSVEDIAKAVNEDISVVERWIGTYRDLHESLGKDGELYYTASEIYNEPLYEIPSDRKVYGYACIASGNADEIRQSMAGYDTGIPETNIFIDLLRKPDDERDDYDHLMKLLKQDDLLYIKSVDCLGGNYNEIIKQWKYIVEDKKAEIAVIDTPMLDTRRSKGMLDTMLMEVVLMQLSYLYEDQKKKRKKRQAEGISNAKAKGIQFGRPGVALPDNFDEIVLRYKRKELTVSEAADMCNMARTTFYDRASRYEQSVKTK